MQFLVAYSDKLLQQLVHTSRLRAFIETL